MDRPGLGGIADGRGGLGLWRWQVRNPVCVPLDVFEQFMPGNHPQPQTHSRPVGARSNGEGERFLNGFTRLNPAMAVEDIENAPDNLLLSHDTDACRGDVRNHVFDDDGRSRFIDIDFGEANILGLHGAGYHPGAGSRTVPWDTLPEILGSRRRLKVRPRT